MKKIRLLIVDDSAFMRQIIRDLLEGHQEIEVIGYARHGKDALLKIRQLNPDVVTLDVEMPVMDGIQALREIMETHPLPVIMLSSTTTNGAENTIQAMQEGAVDFITKPSQALGMNLEVLKEKLIEKIMLASTANISAFKKVTKSRNVVQSVRNTVQATKKIVCIGTSTGGPRALQEVLTKMPKEIDYPIVIVQHMPEKFTKSLATRLNMLSIIHVKEAEHEEVLKNGVAYIAPGGFQMKIDMKGQEAVAHLNKGPLRNGHRPSVNVLFESLIELRDYQKVAVIMTGMGSDGTEGLKALKKSGNVMSIAESKETSVVFGMPRTAIAANVVDYVLNVDEIAMNITKHFSR